MVNLFSKKTAAVGLLVLTGMLANLTISGNRFWLPSLEAAQDKSAGKEAKDGKTKGKNQKSDLELLQGTWQVESAVQNGGKLAEEFTKAVQFVFSGDSIEVKFGDAVFKGKFTTDATKEPKQVDLTPELTTNYGIYEIKDNKLTLCWVYSGRKEDRPKEFNSTEDNGATLVTLIRVPEKKADKGPAGK
jgi:uncharacterized protein (TIGR03067 family)